MQNLLNTASEFDVALQHDFPRAMSQIRPELDTNSSILLESMGKGAISHCKNAASNFARFPNTKAPLLNKSHPLSAFPTVPAGIAKLPIPRQPDCPRRG
jgi:hypothetical protein